MSVAGSLSKFLPFFETEKAHKVLDYGAGTLRNSTYLTSEGFEVFATDLPEQLRRVQHDLFANETLHFVELKILGKSRLNVDVVISTFVLNVIADKEEREEYLYNIFLNLRLGGYLLVEVRGRSFSQQELDIWVDQYGFWPLSYYFGRSSIGVLYKLGGKKTDVRFDA